MRQRAKRELTILGVVVLVVAALIFINYTTGLEQLVKRYDDMRRTAEAAREAEGMEILKWRHMRDTEGSLRGGPTFTDELKAWNNKQVNLIGFMVPENEFRDVKEFILLPLPIECYFCKRPPVDDVMMIQMAEGTTTKIFEGAVLINGVLRLHEGAQPEVLLLYHPRGPRAGGAGRTSSKSASSRRSTCCPSTTRKSSSTKASSWTATSKRSGHEIRPVAGVY
jgi:hypothetical protein